MNADNRWEAVTANGTLYSYKNGILKIATDRVPPYSFKPWTMVSIDRETLLSWDKIEFELIHEMEWATRPTVGEHFFVANPDMWRLSSRMVEVRDLSTDEEAE